ncbi:signal peptide peptidase SppA [Helicobacter sp. 23-1045]
MKAFKTIWRFFVLKPLNFIQNYFKSCLFILLVIVLCAAFTPPQTQNINLAKIYLEGPIFRSDLFATQIESLKNFPNLRGVLLVIDSPGGGLSPSVEIADMIEELNAKIPVVAYVRGTMASGSYYAGMYSRFIVANRGAMIGSIGVIFNGYNIEELLGKIGIQSQGLKAGEFKEAGTFTRKWSENERAYLQKFLNQQYAMFVRDVANARAKTLGQIDYRIYAEGKIFNAYDAKEVGLIDLVGTQKQAINLLQELSGVSNPVWAKEGVIDSYLKKFSAEAVSAIFSQINTIR